MIFVLFCFDYSLRERPAAAAYIIIWVTITGPLASDSNANANAELMEYVLNFKPQILLYTNIYLDHHYSISLYMFYD